MVDKTLITGNLGRDPESRKTKSEKSMTQFSVATRKRDGSTKWYTVLTFGKTAENCAQYLRKGSRVYAEGEVESEQWIGQDGQAKGKLKLLANTVEFLSSKNDSPHIPPSESFDSAQVGGSGYSPAPTSDVTFEDDDIPF